MKVRDLIKALAEQAPDAQVVVDLGEIESAGPDEKRFISADAVRTVRAHPIPIAPRLWDSGPDAGDVGTGEWQVVVVAGDTEDLQGDMETPNHWHAAFDPSGDGEPVCLGCGETWESVRPWCSQCDYPDEPRCNGRVGGCDCDCHSDYPLSAKERETSPEPVSLWPAPTNVSEALGRVVGAIVTEATREEYVCSWCDDPGEVRAGGEIACDAHEFWTWACPQECAPEGLFLRSRHLVREHNDRGLARLMVNYQGAHAHIREDFNRFMQSIMPVRVVQTEETDGRPNESG